MLKIILLVALVATLSNAFDSSDLDFKPLSKKSTIVKKLTDFVLDNMQKKLTLGRARCKDVKVELRQVVNAERAFDSFGYYYQIVISTRVVSTQCKFAFTRSPCVAYVFLPKVGKKVFQLEGLECIVELN